MNKPQMEPEKKKNTRGGGEGENQFSQREAGWSNGGLKEEDEEERTYFPLITSRSLSGKPSKLASLQPPRSSDLCGGGMESSCFFLLAAIRL